MFQRTMGKLTVATSRPRKRAPQTVARLKWKPIEQAEVAMKKKE